MCQNYVRKCCSKKVWEKVRKISEFIIFRNGRYDLYDLLKSKDNETLALRKKTFLGVIIHVLKTF